jgi:hypothetical protein
VAGPVKTTDFSGYKLLIPVIVTYEEALGLEAVRQIAEREFVKALQEKNVNTERIGPLLVLTIGEVEVLESLTRKYGCVQLLKEYAAHVRQKPTYRVGGFSKFLQERGYVMDAQAGPSLAQRNHQRAFDEAQAIIERVLPARLHEFFWLSCYGGGPCFGGSRWARVSISSYRLIWNVAGAAFRRGGDSGRRAAGFRKRSGRWPHGWRKRMGSVAPPQCSALITTV